MKKVIPLLSLSLLLGSAACSDANKEASATEASTKEAAQVAVDGPKETVDVKAEGEDGAANVAIDGKKGTIELKAPGVEMNLGGGKLKLSVGDDGDDEDDDKADD